MNDIRVTGAEAASKQRSNGRAKCPDPQDSQQGPREYLRGRRETRDTRRRTASLILIKLSNFIFFYTSQFKGEHTRFERG